MLRWCAYCQEFQGEIAPLDVLTTTHGICAACEARNRDHLNDEITQSHRLRQIQGLLYEAGRIGDTETATRVVNLAIASGVRPVDILIGIITPLLYRIGIEWETSLITVSDEHRFTRFCEFVFKLVKQKVDGSGSARKTGRPLVFLVNAPGNRHNLGIRILSLWFQAKGIETHDFKTAPYAESIAHLAFQTKPRAILISVALEKQQRFVHTVAKQLELLPEHRRPALIVGGYAIKQRIVQPIPGVQFVEDIIGLDELIFNLPKPGRKERGTAESATPGSPAWDHSPFEGPAPRADARSNMTPPTTN